MKSTRRRSPHRSPSRRRQSFRLAPGLDAMESRICLSSCAKVSPLAGNGVDAIALGDVNGDRVADYAVATHSNGQTEITIYSGIGAEGNTSTSRTSNVLVTLINPLGSGVGPLDIAFGDFEGKGVSDLAVSTTGPSKQGTDLVAIWSFQVVGASPINAAVTAKPLMSPFIPKGFGGASGLTIAAADVNGDGRDDLLVGSAGLSRGNKPTAVTAFDLPKGASRWQVDKVYGHAPINLSKGVSFATGDVTGDGVTDLVVASKANGKVAVYSGSLGRWVWTIKGFDNHPAATRVSVVSDEGASGSVVITGETAKGSATAKIVPYATGKEVRFQPAQSPGSGDLIPLGAGYVYQWSTIKDPTAKAPTSDGPVTPTVLFASTGGDKVIVQGFDSKLTPSKADTYVEPLAILGATDITFHPLQPVSDPSAVGESEGTDSTDVKTNLIVYPHITYHSPYSIDLSSAPKTITDGLEPNTSITTTKQDGWGPAKVANTPPTVPDGAGNDWLRQRLLDVYASVIGLDYQHHHDPIWTPAQGGEWNLASTVAYQSQGVDCTNFTAWAYSQALGITMNSDTVQQAAISPTNPNGTIIPQSLAGRVSIQTITQWSSYDDLVSQLQPGDILIVNGSNKQPDVATHAITWLGSYGKDSNGKDVNLIIDSTGITPSHVDSTGQVPPEGIEIRPFGAPGTLNDWYYTHVGHVLRFIDSNPTKLAPI